MSGIRVADSVEARQQRRRAAGRSGGQFEIVRDGCSISYRYVWPDKEQDFVDRLVSWACAAPPQDSLLAESQKRPRHIAQAETNKDNPNKEGIDSSARATGSKAAGDDVGCIEMMAPKGENAKERGAFTRLNRRISGWLQRKKDDREDQGWENISGRASEQDQSWTSKPQLPPVESESRVKEQLNLEVDRVTRHEDVNWEFFTAPHYQVDSARQFDHGIRCSQVVDDPEFSDVE